MHGFLLTVRPDLQLTHLMFVSSVVYFVGLTFCGRPTGTIRDLLQSAYQHFQQQPQQEPQPQL